ncbi:MAG: hypothetical protein H6997_09365 [Moraxellaceae bacterium]|nr:hypothetical protein [Pseudomonadales bacterium]MCP5177744.1 hypothetical protein [Moraxellaceae bacterium]
MSEYIKKTVTVTVEKTLEISIPSHLIYEMLKDVNEAIDSDVKTQDDLFNHVASHAAQNYNSCECVGVLINGFYLDSKNKDAVRFVEESYKIEANIET